MSPPSLSDGVCICSNAQSSVEWDGFQGLWTWEQSLVRLPRGHGRGVVKSADRTGLFCAWRTAATLAAGVCGTRRSRTRCQWETFEGGGYGNARAPASGAVPPSLALCSVPASLSLCLWPASRGACTEPLDHWVRPRSVCRVCWQLQIPCPLGLGTSRRGPSQTLHHPSRSFPQPLPQGPARTLARHLASPAALPLPALAPVCPSQGLGSAL